MRIDRIEIAGFGKYKDYSLDLGEGIQILYGQNEAGKTTLQTFILSMLFGMKKPGKKRIVYHENHARYLPWDGKFYGGKLHLTIHGTSYTIERNFIKNREECKIYLTATGEDVSHQFPEDNRKEKLFLQTLLGVDELMFKNALCLGDHLRSEWEEWRTETAPKLVSGSHLQTTDQALIQKAEEVLKQKSEEIGTERAESKALGQAAAKRRQLKEDIRLAEEENHAISQLYTDLEQQQSVCEQKRINWTEKKRQIAGRIMHMQDRLQAERAALEASLAGEGQAAALLEGMSEEAYQHQRTSVHRKLEGYRSAYHERANYRSRIAALQQEDPESDEIAKRYETLTDADLQAVDEIEQKLLSETREAPVSADTGTKGQQAGGAGLQRPLLIAGIGLILLGAAGFLLDWKIGLVLAVIGGGLALASQFGGRRVNYQLQREREADRARHQELELLEQKLQKLLERFDADTPHQARSRWQQIMQAKERLAGRQRQLAWLTEELEKAAERLRTDLAGIQHVCGNEHLAADPLPDDVEQFVRSWEDKAAKQLNLRKAGDQLKQKQKEIDRWSAVLDILGVDPLPVHPDENELTPEELEAELRTADQLERLYLDEKSKQTALEVKVQTLRQGRKGMADLVREYTEWSHEENRLNKMKKALEAAGAAFEEVRNVMYREQAPVLVQRVTELAREFTAGRYSELKVDKHMQIRVTSPDSGYTFEMESLSKGTWDQMNFALALAVSEAVVENGANLPLLIDEPFLHYDDQRLENTLRQLIFMTEMRQILFFTHRAQDVEKLKQLGGVHVLVHNLVIAK